MSSIRGTPTGIARDLELLHQVIDRVVLLCGGVRRVHEGQLGDAKQRHDAVVADGLRHGGKCGFAGHHRLFSEHQLQRTQTGSKGITNNVFFPLQFVYVQTARQEFGGSGTVLNEL